MIVRLNPKLTSKVKVNGNTYTSRCVYARSDRTENEDMRLSSELHRQMMMGYESE